MGPGTTAAVDCFINRCVAMTTVTIATRFRLCTITSSIWIILLCLSNILISVAGSDVSNAAGGSRKLQLADEFVSTHNEARAQVGADLLPMNWNLTLQKYALSWAQNLAWNRNCELEHSAGPFGENIFWASWKSSPTEAVDAWVSERQYYHYATNSCSAPDNACGHYTQVVWRDSLYLGCASVSCLGTAATFTVCSYDPPGNWDKQFPY